MSDFRKILGLKRVELYKKALKKLTVSPNELNEEEKTFLLSVAIVLVREYEKDHRLTSYVELAYFIVLKYSLSFDDYTPLYDFSVNVGFYPIARAIVDTGKIEDNSIASALIPFRIDMDYKHGSFVETYEQKQARQQLLENNREDTCYVAPTSFGKSSLVLERIRKKWETDKRVAIIVPTKSLLMQTYRAVRREKFDAKIIIHDEMYNNEERFIAVLTQERALRLLDKNDVSFDCLYIDEAHHIFERDSRSILLSRLIRVSRRQNEATRVVYLSPLITDSDNLKMDDVREIFEQRISFSIKEPDYFEYRLDGTVWQYSRFLDEFFPVENETSTMFQYIIQNATEKTFCYLYRPMKIEEFSKELSAYREDIEGNSELNNIIESLKEYVHEDFYAIDYLKKGIVYLHGKIPDSVKEYLEYKYSKLSELQFLIANRVVLEGVNLPIDSLFILNGYLLSEKLLSNLIGRVNRLNKVFGKSPQLDLLIPKIHFVNSDAYNRQNGNLGNSIKGMKSSILKDKVENPILNNFDMSRTKDKDKEEIREIIRDEEFIFSGINTPQQQLKRQMISLGMNTIYSISDELCQRILEKIAYASESLEFQKLHFLERLAYIFVTDCNDNITDDEFRRLQNVEAISYYKMFFDNRRYSLKENILRQVKYFKWRIAEKRPYFYVGESYGDSTYANGNGVSNAYVDLSVKNEKELVNIAIVKQKMEEDFVSFKLRMFFQLMKDYSVLNEDEYHEIVYGTSDKTKIALVKTGLTINLINRLEKDGQLENIKIDARGNLFPNESFKEYMDNVDDFYRFTLSRFF